MRTIITTYILLALASWSALAAPHSWSSHNNGNANGNMNFSCPSLLDSHFAAVAPQKRQPSSMLTGRQSLGNFDMGIGPAIEVLPKTPSSNTPSPNALNSKPPDHDSDKGCDSASKDDSDSKSKGNADNKSSPPLNYMDLTQLSNGLGPATHRRHLRSLMRRNNKDASVDIFERGNAHAPPHGLSVKELIALGHSIRVKAAAKAAAKAKATAKPKAKGGQKRSKNSTFRRDVN
jgi:hypothetical protein